MKLCAPACGCSSLLVLEAEKDAPKTANRKSETAENPSRCPASEAWSLRTAREKGLGGLKLGALRLGLVTGRPRSAGRRRALGRRQSRPAPGAAGSRPCKAHRRPRHGRDGHRGPGRTLGSRQEPPGRSARSRTQRCGAESQPSHASV